METVLITGANRGIGLELTKRFLDAGSRVLGTYRDLDYAKELAKLAKSSALSLHRLDVSDAQSVDHLRDKLRDMTIDVLVNNAGIMGGERQSLDDMDYSAWVRAFEVNTIAPFRLITSLRANLQQSDNPRAVTLSSQMGALSRQSTGSHAYRSSKAAVNKVMQVLSMELKADGIVVCPVHPGWVRTDMGGNAADISVEESGSGLFDLIGSLTAEHSGRFWTWEGKEHPW